MTTRAEAIAGQLGLYVILGPSNRHVRVIMSFPGASPTSPAAAQSARKIEVTFVVVGSGRYLRILLCYPLDADPELCRGWGDAAIQQAAGKFWNISWSKDKDAVLLSWLDPAISAATQAQEVQGLIVDRLTSCGLRVEVR